MQRNGRRDGDEPADEPAPAWARDLVGEVRGLMRYLRERLEPPRRRRRNVDDTTSGTTTRWLSVEQVAHALGRHPVTTRADLRAGRLSGVRFGRSWRVRADVLDALLDARGKQQVADREDRQRVEEARARAKARAAARRRAAG